jgi:hypothetical protein
VLMDKITESIAHFIGLFNTAVEEDRQRDKYNEFAALRAKEQEQPEIAAETAGGRSPYEFKDFDPSLHYMPLPPDLVWVMPWSPVNFVPPLIPDVPGQVAAHAGSLRFGFDAASSFGSHQAFEIDPPGSIAVHINQTLRLSDGDYVGIGDSGLRFDPMVDLGGKLASLLVGGAQFAPLNALEEPGSGEEIGDFIMLAPSALEAFAEQHKNDENVTIVSGDDVEGVHVNGKAVAEAPKLDDVLPKEEEEPIEQEPVKFAAGEVQIEASVTLEAGGNTLVNESVMTSNWLVGGVTAVLGNYASVNAIVQANVWSDSDALGASLNGWTIDTSKATKAFNVAAFQTIDLSAQNPGETDATSQFPKAWAVTEIEGDLILMNWIQQFNVVVDNDVHMLASSGVTTTVTTGENTGINGVSLYELGHHYDLIIVGGSMYDGNLIQQLNVLLDDDLIGGVADFQTSGQASASTSGNLLWNSAEIINVGGTNNLEAMPDHFKALAEAFADGGRSISNSVLHDGAFAGIEGLRVLYISGNVFNLNYVEQTNVLGDADQVALAMDSIGQAHPEADWTIATGGNALINIASIVDVDFTEKAYVGGQQYSDDILIQAELVSPQLDLGGRDPDALVNEAVAFLDDDMAGDNDDAPPTHQIDAPHADIMQSMLA